MQDDRRVVAVGRVGGEIRAISNRCPHEGYPLHQGVLKQCVLTCNWHNWKFDLRDGSN
ncbi:MAG: Rieske (2Fe-2S) protein, partial [Gemmataceae bacterium]